MRGRGGEATFLYTCDGRRDVQVPVNLSVVAVALLQPLVGFLEMPAVEL